MTVKIDFFGKLQYLCSCFVFMPDMEHTDNNIIDGLRSFDTEITKEYFYGYCRRAYNIYDYKYQLHNKTGLDFYSLAHEYYIHLLKYEFKPLLDKPKDLKLSTWMTQGFHFVVLDALKAYNKEFEHQAVEASDVVLEYVRSTDHEEGMLFNVAEAVANHYHDRIMPEIAHMLFYAGFKQKEVAAQLGMTPAAVNQRYKKMMEEVVTPYIIENYGMGLYMGKTAICEEVAMPTAAPDFAAMHDMCKDSITTRASCYVNARRITPSFISTLKPNEIFVFGSNLQGIHAGGAARMARLNFGAEMGNGVGVQGQSYAIPTMQGGVETIKPYVDEFLKYAAQHPTQDFLVTPIGCGIAGFEPEDIAPLFAVATDFSNVYLPEEFLDVINDSI